MEPSRFPRAQIPGAGAIGTARSVAKLYGSLDALLDTRTLSLGRTTLSEGWDLTLAQPLRFGVGFQLSTELSALGPVPDAFGHPGAGGSTHGCWPRHRVGFSYAMNLMRDDPDEARGQVLLQALFECVSSKGDE
jgi:hypothetical protein